MQRYALLHLLLSSVKTYLSRLLDIIMKYYYSHWQKRLFDLVIAILLFFILSPLLLIVAVLICLDSPGGIFYIQTRVGKNGRRFTMWKFRSMVKGADQQKHQLNNDMSCGVLFKVKQDPRITRVGRLIRRFSIDELPQLWNVIIGDMSIVGPRPALPDEVLYYTKHEQQRLAVTPGITCFWQIAGRSEISFHQQVELDLYYIANQSFWTDVSILLKTIPAVLTGRGAY
jgi:exopolysaccharide biosynthesis polyprenyl glycosylphosphotransferase